MSNVAQVETNANKVAVLPPENGLMADKCDTEEAPGRVPFAEQIKGVVADALGAIAQSSSADQFRGYANEAIGGTKFNIGLAVGSPELTLLGIAQKALGQAQRYIGDAKAAIEADLFPQAIVIAAFESTEDKTARSPEEDSRD